MATEKIAALLIFSMTAFSQPAYAQDTPSAPDYLVDLVKSVTRPAHVYVSGTDDTGIDELARVVSIAPASVDGQTEPSFMIQVCGTSEQIPVLEKDVRPSDEVCPDGDEEQGIPGGWTSLKELDNQMGPLFVAGLRETNGPYVLYSAEATWSFVEREGQPIVALTVPSNGKEVIEIDADGWNLVPLNDGGFSLLVDDETLAQKLKF